MCTSLSQITSWWAKVGLDWRRGCLLRSSPIPFLARPPRSRASSGVGVGGGFGGEDVDNDDDFDAPIIASPKDVKRTKAGARRMRDDARAVAEALHSASTANNDSAPSSSRHRRNVARLAKYARWGDDVKGFFEPGLLQLYLALDALHEQRGVAGALAEIGVYHGKSFIPLALLRRESATAHASPAACSELCLAVDCFDSQEFNLDHSGEGDRAAFERNVEAAARACCEGEGEGEGDEGGDDGNARGGVEVRVGGGGGGGGGAGGGWLRVLQTDSLTLSTSSVSSAVDGQPVRLFSIDGSHTCEATAADLSTASAALHPEGVVIVDDAFNADWPGVMTGLFRWYYEKAAAAAAAAAATATATATVEAAAATEGAAAAAAATVGARAGAGSGAAGVAELVPFAIGFNKVVMCRPDMHAVYFSHLVGGGGDGGGGYGAKSEVDASSSSPAWPRVRKTASFMGHEVAVLSHGWIATFHGNK